MKSGFLGRHYESGTIVNALAAMGAKDPKTDKPYSEALALGASGGLVFGYFVFEYKGHLPHVALLTRNTFSPFERTLDNLAIKRDTRETTDGARAEKNLRLELDSGNVAIVWADLYSLPYKGLDPTQMWIMAPLLVIGYEREDFIVVDGAHSSFKVLAATLAEARGRVKKDRHRMYVLEAPDAGRLPEGLVSGIKTCTALFLDKPPAGSANNFGIPGMRHMAKMLTDERNAKGWARTFEPGPRLLQALAGTHGQPGVWDWIANWGSAGSGDRDLYADFLMEASGWLGTDLSGIAKGFRESAGHWRTLADTALADEVPEFKRLKELKRRHALLWVERNLEALDERAAIREEMKALTEKAATALIPAREIQRRMAGELLAIAEIEEDAVSRLRGLVG